MLSRIRSMSLAWCPSSDSLRFVDLDKPAFFGGMDLNKPDRRQGIIVDNEWIGLDRVCQIQKACKCVAWIPYSSHQAATDGRDATPTGNRQNLSETESAGRVKFHVDDGISEEPKLKFHPLRESSNFSLFCLMGTGCQPTRVHAAHVKDEQDRGGWRPR